MPAEHNKKLFARFLLGVASDKEKSEIYGMKESEQMLKEQWDSEVSENLPDSTKRNLLHSILRKTTQRPRILRLNPVVAAAAAIFLGLIIGSIVLFQFLSPSDSMEMASFESQPGQRSSYTLPDGSEVLLAGSSKIDFPAEFGKDYREVRLTGEAFFEISPNESTPFLVMAQDITVMVTGTRFSVTCYPGDEVTQTILLSGKVRVECTAKSKCYQARFVLNAPPKAKPLSCSRVRSILITGLLKRERSAR
jgi:ferric-dicitrate binding protein FerR (iron transport regulator)